MGWGDEILAAGQAQRLYDGDPSMRIAIMDKFGRPRWHDIWEGNPIIARPADVEAGEAVRRIVSGPDCRPYVLYPFTAESGWTFNKTFLCRDHIAKLYLTPQERRRGEMALDQYGPYVLIEPFTKHANFRWPIEKWVELVESRPDLTFVQHTHKESSHVPGAHYEPATFREACGLIASASVYLRSESGLCHAAAALGVRTVTIFGGCMDPDVMGGYPLQTMIVDRGPGSPCGTYNPCPHCAVIMSRLTVDDVSGALRQALSASRQECAA